MDLLSIPSLEVPERGIFYLPSAHCEILGSYPINAVFFYSVFIARTQRTRVWMTFNVAYSFLNISILEFK